MAIFHIAMLLKLKAVLQSSWCQESAETCFFFGISSVFREYLFLIMFPVIWHIADSLQPKNLKNQFQTKVLSYKIFGCLYLVFLGLSYVWDISTTADYYGRWQTPAAIVHATDVALLAVLAVCVTKLLAALFTVGHFVRRMRPVN